jgi:murein DD-endopeptidase MepM/ murein hydrolase activator NlpD
MWVWFGVGAGVALLLSSRRESATPRGDRWQLLGMPVDGGAAVTAHGFFGASRLGPPVHAHQGVDLAARPGDIVRAVGDGRVVATNPGLGKVVRKLQLDPPGSWGDRDALISHVVYADLGQPLVDVGQCVRKGDSIARVARDGFVHFAVKRVDQHGEEFIDPARAGFTYRMKGVA